MSKPQPMPITMIRHRGFFDYEKLVQTWQDWFAEQDFDYPSSDFQTIHPQKLTDFGWEVRAEFFADKKVTEYVKFIFKLRVILQNMKEVELIVEGKKRKLMEGLATIDIIPLIQFDYQERFPEGKGKIVEWMGKALEKYILKYKIGDYWEDMLLDMSTALAKELRHVLEQEVT